MDKNCTTMRSHEEINSSSDEEPLHRPREEPKISGTALECGSMDPSPKEAGTEQYGEAKIKKDPKNVPFIENEESGWEIPSTGTSEIENIMDDDPQCDKMIPVSTKSSEKEVIYTTKENISANTGSTSETQDSVDSCSDVGETERNSPEDAAAEALFLEYMKKYASEYSKELLFAMDVMTLVRHLNKLELKYIMYSTNGSPPYRSYDATLEKALTNILEYTKKDFEDMIESRITTEGINYNLFQKTMLELAEKIERLPFKVMPFFYYCLLLAQWAVRVESYGVQTAYEFVPLVICRTLQNLKDSGRLPTNFWEMIATKESN